MSTPTKAPPKPMTSRESRYAFAKRMAAEQRANRARILGRCAPAGNLPSQTAKPCEDRDPVRTERRRRALAADPDLAELLRIKQPSTRRAGGHLIVNRGDAPSLIAVKRALREHLGILDSSDNGRIASDPWVMRLGTRVYSSKVVL